MVFRRRDPSRLVLSPEPGVLKMDDASSRRRTGVPLDDHDSDQSPQRAKVVDVAIVLVVTFASLVGFIERAKQALDGEDLPLRYAGLDLPGTALTLVACLALLGRRAFPGSVLLVTTLATVSANAAGYPPAPMPYAVVVAAFTVGQRWPFPRSVLAVAPAALALAVSAFARFGMDVDDEVLTEVLAVFAAWALGRGYRLGRMHTRLLEERTRLLEQQARHLTREQSSVAALAAARERANIARELHDVVAGNVGIIVAQAAAARRRLRHSSGGSPEVLASVESLGREALTDMRRLVGVLRSIDDGSTEATLPSLDQLEELVAKVAGTGTHVELVVTGERRALPPAVEINAYRIVQESLTNAMKHAKGSPVTVTVDYGRERLHLLVRDEGPGAGDVLTPGNGLLGMRQRVDLLGGTLRTGTAPGGGFLVDCLLPTTASTPGPTPPPPEGPPRPPARPMARPSTPSFARHPAGAAARVPGPEPRAPRGAAS